MHDSADPKRLMCTCSVRAPLTERRLMDKHPAGDRITPRVTSALRHPKGSAIKSIALMAKPTTISLAGGIPLDSTFPFESIQFDLTDGTHIVAKNRAISGGTQSEDGAANLPLNYVSGYGIPELREVLTAHMKEFHDPPTTDWAVVPVTGSTDALVKCFQLLKPDEGKAIVLGEALVWAAVLAIAETVGYEVVGVELDGDGMIPEALEKTLTELQARGESPAFLYTTPNGQNPTGSSLSLERKKQIYAVASRFDLIIVEDDPYRLLSLPDNPDAIDEAHMPGVHGLPPSLLSLDTEGRVIHLESLSKWICPGLRVGWVTGPKAFIEGAFRIWSEITVQFPCTVSQCVLAQMLRTWGTEGIDKHLRGIQAHYAKQRRAFMASADKHLTGLATWTVPKAGMFVWVKVLYLRGKGRAESEALFHELVKEDVLVVPGYAFDATGGAADPAFRLTFATALPEKMEEAIARVGRVLARAAATATAS